MKTSLLKNSFKSIIALAIITMLVGFGFAQSSGLANYGENREIKSADHYFTAAADQCNPYETHAFYVGSDVYFKLLSESLGTYNRRIEDGSFAYIYGNIFAAGLQIPFITNLQPKLGSVGLGGDTKVLITKATGKFEIQEGYTFQRNKPAGEIITKNYYRYLYNTGNPESYFFTTATTETKQNISVPSKRAPSTTTKTACMGYYLAYCGDGVIDKATGSGPDGQGGIQTLDEGFKTRNPNSIKPNEVCDEGTLNGQPGHCKIDCSGGGGPIEPVDAQCLSLIVTGTVGQYSQADFTCYGSGAAGYKLVIKDGAGNIIYPPSTNPNAGTHTGTEALRTWTIGSLPAGDLTAICTVIAANGNPGICTGNFNGPITQLPILNIKKTIVGNPDKYHPGDTVTFRIDFSNTGSGNATNVRIQDFLPRALDFVGSQIYGVNPPYYNSNYTIGSDFIIEYSGFLLTPGQTGYILITGKLRSYDLCNQTLNNSYIKSMELPNDLYAGAIFTCAVPSANITISKIANPSNVYLGSTIGFTIFITNNGPDPVTNVQISDVRPNTYCVAVNGSYSSNVPLQANGLNRTLSGTLNAGQTISIYLSGNISTDPSCIGTYSNIANLSYLLGIQNLVGQAIAPFTISAIPVGNIDLQKIVIQTGSKKGDTVIYEIRYTNSSNDTATYNLNFTDHRPVTLNFVSANPMPRNYNASACAQGCDLLWTINKTMHPKETGIITITGTIK